MNYEEIRNFFKHINEYTEQEIISNLPNINTYFRITKNWPFIKECVKELLKKVDKEKLLLALFENEKNFSWWNKKLDLPENLKFGVEIEVASLPLDVIRNIFEFNLIDSIMKILKIPDRISERIIKNSEFEKKDKPNKWIFSREAYSDESEASSPILKNKLDDLNEIVAICTLLKAFNAELHGGTGLHINVGVDYLKCNENAVENLLKLWGECEELFFKMANPEGETIRIVAHNMATPIKENVQEFLEGDGSITLNTEEDMERFLYQIQARNRMDEIVAWSGECLEFELLKSRNDEERFKVYHRYEEINRKKENPNSKVRWTSINFNHMKWNADNPGRIEIRIFNSSLEPEVIFQDLLLVGKIFEVSLENAKDPNYKKEEFRKLFLRDVTETRKVNNLLNLLFDNDEQKKIFKERWKSIKGNQDYQRYQSGRDTFLR